MDRADTNLMCLRHRIDILCSDPHINPEDRDEYVKRPSEISHVDLLPAITFF